MAVKKTKRKTKETASFMDLDRRNRFEDELNAILRKFDTLHMKHAYPALIRLESAVNKIAKP